MTHPTPDNHLTNPTLQNSEASLNTTYEGFFSTLDYIDHLTACLGNPTSLTDGTKLELPCMADFGGPILPNVALGGYPGTAPRE